MKKTFLLISAGLIAGFANGQEAQKSLLFQPAASNAPATANVRAQSVSEPFGANQKPGTLKYGAKTTATTTRWFNFAGYEDTSIGSANTGASYTYMWFTKDALFPYGPTPDYQANNNVSVGTIFDPTASAFVDLSYYAPGLMAVQATNAYTVDSVEIAGVYHRNPTKHTVVDTIRLTYTYGPKGGTGSNVAGYKTWGYIATYGTDTIQYLTDYWDSAANKGTQVTGGTVPVYTQDILLREIDTILGLKDTAIKLSTSLLVPAGNVVALNLTFRSGDPLATNTFNDTVWRYPANTYKYGEFRPLFINNMTGGSLHWPDVNHTAPAIGWNMGLQQLEPASRGTGQTPYFASFELTSGTNPNSDQYPWFGFHLSCGTCPLTGISLGVNTVISPSSIRIYPNPANNELNVSFSTKASSVNAALVNMLGEVVASQTVTGNSATFNTASVPAGIYLLTLTANGERTTSRVVVAH